MLPIHFQQLFSGYNFPLDMCRYVFLDIKPFTARYVRFNREKKHVWFIGYWPPLCRIDSSAHDAVNGLSATAGVTCYEARRSIGAFFIVIFESVLGVRGRCVFVVRHDNVM